MANTPYNNRGLQKRKEVLEERERHQLETDLREVMGTPSGRRLYWHILANEGLLFSSSFHPSGSETAFAEGKRAVAISLMTRAQRVCAELYVRMMDEQLRSKADKEVRRQVEEMNAAQKKETDDGY